MSQADVAVLRSLRAAAPAPVAIAELVRHAAQTHEELAATIADLRSAGYEIEEQKDRDYRFCSAPDRLIADDVRAGLGDVVLGSEIIVLEQTSSTNDFLLRIAGPQVREGLVAFAEGQTAGRGQHGHRWASAPRLGLWFSILLRPQLALTESSRLTAWIAQSIAGTISDELTMAASVKAPNDVYVGDRKIAGVLVEMRATERPHIAIAGVGINVNQQLEDFPEGLRERAGSLAMMHGCMIDRRDLAVAVLRDLDRSYRAAFAP